MRYFLLAAMSVFAVVVQVRLSLETVHMQRTLDHFVPFLLQPFTAKLCTHSSAANWEKHSDPSEWKRLPRVLRPGDQVVAINGRPFTGLSSYLGELWKSQHQVQNGSQEPQSDPFRATVVTPGGPTREIEFAFPHCTCSIPGRFDALFFWMAAPLFCICVGALTAALRPRSLLAWSFFGLMLSLSQLQFWREPYAGFQITTDPVAWRDSLRVPAVFYRAFVQYSWPFALALPAFCGWRNDSGRSHPLQVAFLAVLFLFAAAKASVAVAWSEGIQGMAPVYFLLEQHKTQALALSFVLAAVAVWTGNRRAGAVAGLLAGCAILALFAPPAPIKHGHLASYSEETVKFRATIPVLHRTAGFVTGASVAALLLSLSLLFLRRLGWQPAVAIILCLPLAAHVCAALGAWVYPFARPFHWWPWVVVLTSGAGIALAALWVIRWEAAPASHTTID